MQQNILHIQEFMSFFCGSRYNFGRTIYGEKAASGKVAARSETVTQKLITIEDYRAHFAGVTGLGIIPVQEDNHVKFGVIDVDIYDDDLSIYVRAIERGKFPLVPFYSKSGGLHIYIFFSDTVPAKQAQDTLRQMAFLLSLDTLVKSKKNSIVEIFPKQVSIGRGEVGSWINLPYYNIDNCKNPAIRGDGSSLSFSDALVAIKSAQVRASEVDSFFSTLEYQDAPPCLQLIKILDPLSENSGRNNFLFSFGVYYKKKDENFFEQNLMQLNSTLSNPLPETEVMKTISNSLRKKDYIYKCKESPCADFCNKKICKTRDYGIGKNEGFFSSVEMGQLYQYKTSQPYYEWEARLQNQEDFKRLRFRTEDEIIRQDVFLRLCFRELYELPSKLKSGEWCEKVNSALRDIKIISVDKDDDTSPEILLRSLIGDFLRGRAMAQTRDQILAKRVYFDVTRNEYLFRIQDLTEFVYVSKNFRFFGPQELHGILRGMNCEYRRIRTESGNRLRVGVLSTDVLSSLPTIDTFAPSFDDIAIDTDLYPDFGPKSDKKEDNGHENEDFNDDF